MKKLVLALVLGFGSMSIAHAQHEDLVTNKFERLQTFSARIEIADIDPEKKKWAMEALAKNQDYLMQHKTESDIEKLKGVEQKVNQVNKTVADEILASKKATLKAKIDSLKNLIETYKKADKDASALAVLLAKMEGAFNRLP